MAISVSSTFLSLPRPSLPSFSSSKSSFFNHPTATNVFKTINSGRLILDWTRQPSNVRQLRKKGLTCNCLFGIGLPELVVIAGVAALVFGPNDLPEFGRRMAKTVKNFQQAAKEFEAELKKEIDSSADPIDTKQKPTAVGGEDTDDAKVSISK